MTEGAPDAATMADVLRWQAARRPDCRAFVFLERGEREAGALTYAELDRRATLIARAVVHHRLVGERIILAYPTGLEFVAAVFGCFYGGAVAVPGPVEGFGRNAARLEAIAADASAAAMFTLRANVAPDTESTGLATVLTDELEEHDSSTALPSSAALPSIAPERLALLQYTSGSTGNPRGVMLTHANIIDNQRALAVVLGSSAGDVGVNWLPHYHDMGLLGTILHSVYCGGFSALLPPLAFVQKPVRWLRAIHRYRASITSGPNFAYDLVARQCASRPPVDLDLSCWRVALCGGEPIRPAMLERVAAMLAPHGFDPGAWLPAYGLAEATLIAAAAPAGTGLIAPAQTVAGRRLICCGPVVKGQRLSIVDPESRRPVPDGQTGEIWLQGQSVAAGYWNRPSESLATFGATHAAGAAGTWLRTGDLGFIADAGLVVTGRAKEIIVIRGANFDPVDIEVCAGESDPAFESAGGAAFAVEHADGERLVVLHEVNRESVRHLDADAAGGKIIEALSRHFGLRIHDLVLLRPNTLPRTTSGKIQRHACKAQYLSVGLSILKAVEHPSLGRGPAPAPPAT